jgi:hypothetical protein
MLRDFLDRQMHNLDALESGAAEECWSSRFFQGVTRRSAEVCEDRVALILDPKSHPDRWLFEMVELMNLEDDDARAMAQKSEAAGNPPAWFELVVSEQIAAALLRGHLTPVEA